MTFLIILLLVYYNGKKDLISALWRSLIIYIGILWNVFMFAVWFFVDVIALGYLLGVLHS